MMICQKCKKLFPTSVKIDGKDRILNKRKFCLGCSPFGAHNRVNLALRANINDSKSKTCSRCGHHKFRENFYFTKQLNGKPRTASYCKDCHRVTTVERHRKFKKECVAYKGGKCIDCGFAGHPGVFDFHHTNPLEKDLEISKSKTKKLAIVKSELDKCVLLCANCHRLRHIFGAASRNRT